MERNTYEVHLNSGHERASQLNAMCNVLSASESGFAALRLGAQAESQALVGRAKDGALQTQAEAGTDSS